MQHSAGNSTNPEDELRMKVLDFRLRQGLCHICGVKIFDLDDKGQITNYLTKEGVSLGGRCLYCYPVDEERRRYVDFFTGARVPIETETNNNRKRPAKRPATAQAPDAANENPAKKTAGSAPTKGNDSKMPPTNNLAPAVNPADNSRSTVSLSDVESPDIVRASPSFKGRVYPPLEPVTIRGDENREYTGYVMEGTARKGTGKFRHEPTLPEDNGEVGVYNGDFDNGYFHGHGTLWEGSGAKYVGHWKRGVCHGQGKKIWPDGWQYEGEWQNDLRHGKGKCNQFSVRNGETYEGEWSEDNWNGHGVLRFAGGGSYTGTFKDNNIHGKGRYIFMDNSVYEGDFRDGLRVGKGSMTYADGSHYVGSWQRNWRHGQGTLTYPDGREFRGYFKADDMGKGKWYNKNDRKKNVQPQGRLSKV